MSNENFQDVVLPSSPEDRKKIREALQEMSNSFLRIDAEKDLIKEAINMVSEKYGLPKKFVRKLAVTFHKDTLNDQVQDVSTLEFAYGVIIGNQTIANGE
jgi:hypothetical protein